MLHAISDGVGNVGTSSDNRAKIPAESAQEKKEADAESHSEVEEEGQTKVSSSANAGETHYAIKVSIIYFSNLFFLIFRFTKQHWPDSKIALNTLKMTSVSKIPGE